MKKLFLAALMLAYGAFCAKSQTKGTNAIGLGLSSQTTKQESGENLNSFESEQKATNFSLTYGNFIKNNSKIGLTARYGYGSSESTFGSSSSFDSYGGALHYQHYYPLLKKFFAFAGGRVEYDYALNKITGSENATSEWKSNMYSIGAYGGAAYFLSKRFSFEAQLLSAGFHYHQQKHLENSMKSKQTGFNVSTNGFINNLGFNIYFLF